MIWKYVLVACIVSKQLPMLSMEPRQNLAILLKLLLGGLVVKRSMVPCGMVLSLMKVRRLPSICVQKACFKNAFHLLSMLLMHLAKAQGSPCRYRSGAYPTR